MQSVLTCTRAVAGALVALYLRGLGCSRLSSRRWPAVEGALRRSGCDLSGAAACLRREGMWAEALALEVPGLLARAEALVEEGAVLTLADEWYPARWRRLGPAAPPALWLYGQMPEGQFIAIVGSRQIDSTVEEFAANAAREAVRLDYAVVSGGAIGCDSAATSAAAARCLEVLPYGLQHHRSPKPAVSLFPWHQPFSSAAAMERNALIYAASEAAIVAHARFREGGTWAGAVDALRRRLSPLLVREDPGSQAHRALLALGGKPLATPACLASALAAGGPQPSLL